MKRSFRAANQDDGSLVLYMYDDIGPGWFSDGILAKDVAAAIESAGDVSSITVRINSPGGDVFEGNTIFSLLKSAGVPVKVMVDGLAASAASVIAMAGAEIIMGSNAMMMIHNAWMVAIGDADELRKNADTLDKISGVLVDTYAARTGQTKKAVTEMMSAETWLTAKEAVDLGFATGVYEPGDQQSKAAAALIGDFRLEKRFRRVPPAALQRQEPGPAAAPPSPEPAIETWLTAKEARALTDCERDLLALELSAIGV